MKGVRDEFGKEMLECEIEALKTLKHPNILRCFDVFTTVNNCYIVTEFCNDGDLAGLLSKRRRMSETETIGYLREIVSAFIDIADNNFLHRDLKLANIFLNNGVAKIADFGFAKKNKNPGQKEKYNVGSPLYMSPEALKKNIYSVKNDIWSIGVTLFELLHGQTPWECKTQKELMDKIVRVPVTFTVKVSEELKNFIKKCLEVDESKRMSLDDLRNCSYLRQYQVKTEQFSATSMIPLGKLDLNKKVSQNKENISSQIPRATLDRNNQLLVHYINMFRLLYKIVGSLSQNRSEQKKLIQLLSNQVLDRVGYIKTVSSLSSQKGDVIDLKDPDRYFNDVSNPSIKKYKIVIGEYYKKYNATLKKEEVGGQLDDTLRSFLKTTTLKDPRQVMLFHWMTEYVLMPKDLKKDYLEGIIEPRNKPTLENVQTRLHLVS